MIEAQQAVVKYRGGEGGRKHHIALKRLATKKIAIKLLHIVTKNTAIQVSNIPTVKLTIEILNIATQHTIQCNQKEYIQNIATSIEYKNTIAIMKKCTKWSRQPNKEATR